MCVCVCVHHSVCEIMWDYVNISIIRVFIHMENLTVYYHHWAFKNTSTTLQNWHTSCHIILDFTLLFIHKICEEHTSAIVEILIFTPFFPFHPDFIPFIRTHLIPDTYTFSYLLPTTHFRSSVTLCFHQCQNSHY